MSKPDQQCIALTLVDQVVEAVCGAVREELDELRAELTHIRLEVRELAKRAPPGEPPPLGALPRAKPGTGSRLWLPERRARGGDLIRK